MADVSLCVPCETGHCCLCFPKLRLSVRVFLPRWLHVHHHPATNAQHLRNLRRDGLKSDKPRDKVSVQEEVDE